MSALAAWDWPESKPLSRPRRALTVAASKLAGVVLWSLGFSVRVRGREHLKKALRAKEDRPILIFNHVRELAFPFFRFYFSRFAVVVDLGPLDKNSPPLKLPLSLFGSLSLPPPPLRSPGQTPRS